MKTPKPFEAIASRFQVSNESAKYFLLQVQKSFKTERPPHALINMFMNDVELDLDRLPSPYQVAKMMHDDGVWVHPMHAEPLKPQDEVDVYLD